MPNNYPKYLEKVNRLDVAFLNDSQFQSGFGVNTISNRSLEGDRVVGWRLTGVGS